MIRSHTALAEDRSWNPADMSSDSPMPVILAPGRLNAFGLYEHLHS